ncbi:putative chitinase [Rosa chinensis]|uniref:chitinase n=1 Tax=Rosa chinensis TaxID=74649 RepID=A0A2P6RLF2_ROSCH|nr:putative chitinase [Rosa chinensis]
MVRVIKRVRFINCMVDYVDDPYAWGYCFVNENNQDVYCSNTISMCSWLEILWSRTHSTNPLSTTTMVRRVKQSESDLINNPDLVATDPVVSFKTAMWFWMTPQSNKPSSHDVITGRWNPSDADICAGRVPGYGVITNIMNGGLECGHGQDDKVANRIGFYRRYAGILGVSPGDNLDCCNL